MTLLTSVAYKVQNQEQDEFRFLFARGLASNSAFNNLVACYSLFWISRFWPLSHIGSHVKLKGVNLTEKNQI